MVAVFSYVSILLNFDSFESQEFVTSQKSQLEQFGDQPPVERDSLSWRNVRNVFMTTAIMVAVFYEDYD